MKVKAKEIYKKLKESIALAETNSTTEEFQEYCEDITPVLLYWETRINMLHPHKVFVDIKFEGIDDFHRPVFKEVNGNARFGDVNGCKTGHPIAIINYYIVNIEKLEYFGRKFNCEPSGDLDGNIQLRIVN